MLLEHLLSSRASAPPLRVALLLDGVAIPRPYVLAVEHVLRSDFARLELVVRERAAVGKSQRLVSRRARSAGLAFALYERLDRRRATGSDRLLAPVDMTERLAGIPWLDVGTRAQGETVELLPEAIGQIRARAIDVVLRCAQGTLCSAALTIARFGVWSLGLGDPDSYRGGPAYYWELAEMNPLSGVFLEAAVAGRERPLVLCKGLASTRQGHSLARNRVKPQLLGSTFFIRKLKQLHEEGFAALERCAVPVSPYAGRRARYDTPSAMELATFLAPQLARTARGRLSSRTIEQWKIAVRTTGGSRTDGGLPVGTDGFRWIEAPRGRLYADPHLVRHGGRVYCFFEDLEHAQRRGRISCAVVSGGRLEDVRPALELPYHLSYPEVFESGGDLFMIPESRRNGTVDLFRMVAFPDRWEKVRTLLRGGGLDTTVLRHAGLYWFFVAVREPEEAGEQLLLFHAESLTGPLRYHPQNPISSDARYCRPGGAILVEDGRLIRPSQDATFTYGRKVHFHRISCLTTDAYREEYVSTLLPEPGLQGIHTYARCGGIEVIDGKWLEPAQWHGR